MQSQAGFTAKKPSGPLPPVISNNPRVKLEAEQVSLTCIKLKKEKRILEQSQSIHSVIQPEPFFSHVLAWKPRTLHFEVGDTVVVRKLRVCNASARSVYLQCGRFFNVGDSLGVSWCCLHRTRFFLAPGIVADIYVKATPRKIPPISSAYLYLQLAAAHLRDNVVAFYKVPIFVNFLNYIPV